MPLLLAALALAGGPPLAGGAYLTLVDGRRLEGREVRRDGDVYLLVIEGGAVVPVPSELVAEVGLTAEAEAEKDEAPPSGLREAEPQQLAGVQVEAPRTEQQLAALGKPSRFQEDAVKSGLRPSYWVMDPSQARGNPSTWSKGPVDSSWHPESAFDSEKDVLAGSKSTFQKSIVDSSWKPKDGFAKD